MLRHKSVGCWAVGGGRWAIGSGSNFFYSLYTEALAKVYSFAFTMPIRHSTFYMLISKD